MPSHLTAAQTFDYIKSYAKHFELEQYVRFNTNVKWIERNAENTKWQVCVNDIITEGGEVRDFDKVVVCSGLYERAITPKIEGIEKFTGTSLHVQAFKRYILVQPYLSELTANESISDRKNSQDKESLS